MDPSVVVANNLPVNPKSNKTILSLIILVAVVALIGGVWYFSSRQNQTVQKNTKTAAAQVISSIHKKRDIRGDLERQLKLTFSGTKYYESISLYMSLGSKAKTTAEAYANWLKAYSFVSKAYQDTKKSEYKAVLYQFRDFLKAFPMYKDSEVVIPK